MSSGANQRTLFQTWGTAVSKVVRPKKDVKKADGRYRATPSSTSQTTTTRPPPRNSLWCEVGLGSSNNTEAPVSTEDPNVGFEDEDDDDSLMVVAVYEAEKTLQLDKAHTTLGTEISAPSPIPSGEQSYPDFPGFDSSSAKVWIYPINYPIREYQLKISEAALFQNTLVCLPTGLGKTFIASVVMYNFYRWYPSGKIVFMAPTKPLVAQQIEACYKVMGIPQAHMAELTGSTAAKQRQEVWRTKRVFFLTPQVMVNDLSRDTCPARQVKCVVIDEAHKALGKHAYCQVIQQLGSQTKEFRILALSATPGGDRKAVQSVISNLLISHIELRSEESPDIRAHSHQRSVEKLVVPLGESLRAYQARYLQVLEKFMSRLVQHRVMGHKDLRTLGKYQLILARDQFRKNPPPNIKAPQQGMLEGDFALCISLYHGYELLMQMGLRSLFFYLQGIMDGSREMSRARNELQRTPSFMDLYQEIEAMFVKPCAGPDEPFLYSHPKLEKLEKVVLEHFRQWAERKAGSTGSPDTVSTRVMIFSSFRESVQEIAAMLNCHAPLIRVMTFMGQASAGKGVKGFTQKEQLEVVQRFRQGGFNTLVSTCVGEEGLDIGEVDLIVCFDAQKNPIRLVQRMGRTGRKRQGRIVVILAEGREERIYNQSQTNKRSVYKSIISNQSAFNMYPNSPRMLPEGLNPTLHKMHITCGQFDPQESNRHSVKGRPSSTEGRASLIQPRRSDGFLNSTEYSLWASTMKLKEDEAHPTLPPSHFLSLPIDLPDQEQATRSDPLSRELSLWEWRHWQHKTLPSHVVDHSLRCQHFIHIMDLIDQMKEEKEGECHYEEQLRLYLCNANGHVNKGQTKLKHTKPFAKIGPKKASRPSLSDLDFIDEAFEWTLGEQHSPVDHDCANVDMTSEMYECASNDKPDPEKSTVVKAHENLELQATLYLPKWEYPLSSNKILLGINGDKSLQVILSNVSELLSRSPPSLDLQEEAMDFLSKGASLQGLNQQYQPFQVSFTLNDDEEDKEEELHMTDTDNAHCKADSTKLLIEPPFPNSPTWDSVFDDDVHNDGNGAAENEELTTSSEEKQKRGTLHMEELKCTESGDTNSPFKPEMNGSMDLFGDDEAFLQMSIPDILTAKDSGTHATSPKAPENSNRAQTTCNISFKNTLEHPADSPQRLAELEETINSSNTLKQMNSGRGESYDLAHMAGEEMAKSKTAPLRDNPKSFESSDDLFSVNFDLGFSVEDSEEEDVPGASPLKCIPPSPQPKQRRATSTCSTPCTSFYKQRQAVQLSESTLSTAPIPPHRNMSVLLSSPVVFKGSVLPSPITSPGAGPPAGPHAPASAVRQRQAENPISRVERESSVKIGFQKESVYQPGKANSDSEEEVVGPKGKQRNRFNPLSSPEVAGNVSEADSPLVLKRKCAAALETSSEQEATPVSQDDFQTHSVFTRINPEPERKPEQQHKAKHAARRRGHHFLDQEAELSDNDEAADVSSDEEEGEDQNQSLEGFVVDNSHFSQGLNDSEMHALYLKSVRSPAAPGRFKMSFRNHHNMDIFSQVPEIDETYAEDSFVVGSDEEPEPEHSEDEEVAPLLPEDSYADGRRQYVTRRRLFQLQARAGAKSTASVHRGGVKAKRARVIRVQDSSESEADDANQQSINLANQGSNQPEQEPQKAHSTSSTVASKVSKLSRAPGASVTNNQRCESRGRQRVDNQLDFRESESLSYLNISAQTHPSTSTALPQRSVSPGSAPTLPLCILVDSRCLSGAVELVTCLRQRHSATVHVCSLDGSYFIVSNRMAVERHSQSEVVSIQNRKRLVEKVNSLKALFERVCLIVEKDRTKPGDAGRPFQRTRYYDSTLAALVCSGLRLLWSNSPDESAGLLVDLARLEQRKAQGISVPLEVKGQHRQQALQLYLSLPSVNYVQALNMSHNFSSVGQLINSSIEVLQKGGCMSRSKAEEVYRFLRYSCDFFLMNTLTKTKNH